MMHNDTIAAISTPTGSGGIAVIRLSGPDAIHIASKTWRGASLADAESHTARFGHIVDVNDSVIDEAVATLFRAPRSYTGEDTVEFAVHGSLWIQRAVLSRLFALGARPAEAGEFTQRAFMNGRMDLSQAEAVADLIAASSKAAHRMAMTQMSGAFSRKLDELRSRLVELASLLELELDFSEEDVTFADREKLAAIADETIGLIERLTSTYSAGKALKEGVPVAIAGAPNAGKSTLLNRLLDEDKAIVSDIPGTTRDVIEDTSEIDGILFRFFDTAGLRHTDDVVENIGIERARETIGRASIVLWMIDAASSSDEISKQISEAKVHINAHDDIKNIVLFNKSDIGRKVEDFASELADASCRVICISAKTGDGTEELKERLVSIAKEGHNPESELMVTNARHQAALTAGAEALRRARAGIADGLSADFIAQDIRESLHHLGTVTGAVTTDTLLSSIFSRFCIGK